MDCLKCKKPAPSNVIGFSGIKSWVCPDCEVVKLQDELHKLYQTGAPGRFVYVSDLTNNLDKVNQYFTESVALTNPFCSITLTTPEGCSQLAGAYDGAYIDRGCVTEDHLGLIVLSPQGFVKWVDGTTQYVE